MTQKAKSRHQRLAWLAIIPVLLVAMLIGVDSFLQSRQYPVEELVWEGDFNHVSREQLEQAVMDKVRENYFTVNLKAIESAVRDMPWVSEVKAHRVWPKTIKVRFREQELIARWGGKGEWLNSHGRVVKLPATEVKTESMPLFKGPAIDAEEMLEGYRQFGELLATVPMHILELEMSARRSWRLKVASGSQQSGFKSEPMDIYLDDQRAQKQLTRFLEIYQTRMGPEREQIEYVDLRYPNGFALKQRPQEEDSQVAGSEHVKSKG